MADLVTWHGRVAHEDLPDHYRRAGVTVLPSLTEAESFGMTLVEAMASGCYVIGSDTPPLHDAIEDGVNGRLLPFFDVEALSEAMIAACRDPQASTPLRAAARETAVAKFSRHDGRAAWLDLLREMGVEIRPVA